MNKKKKTDNLDEIQQWMIEDLGKSGLTKDDIDVEPFGVEVARNGNIINNGGYHIIYHDRDGSIMQGANLKPFIRQRFRPPLPERKGVKVKYATIARAGNRCFIQQSVFEYLTENPNAPILITEGEKKAAKANKMGIPMIGLAGIWNWLASKSERSSIVDKYKINRDIVQFLHPYRDVIIIYDSDSKDNRNKANSFDLNTLHFADELSNYDCSLYRVDIPQTTEGKCGLDDYLITHSKEDLLNHIEQTKELIPQEEAIKIRDPYKNITDIEGEPFLIKFTQLGEVSKVTLTQGWNARFLMQNHHIIYEPRELNFYIYNEDNGLWESKSEDYLKLLLSSELGEYWKKFHFNESKYLLPVRNDRILKDSINRLRGLAEEEGAFVSNAKNPVIHLQEGMLELNSLELNNFAPKYYSRNQIPISFDINLECPQFINDLLAPALNEDSIEVLQKYFGMCVMGYNYSQQFLLLEGTAGGGKSTLTDILRSIIGAMNVAEMRTQQLNERFELAAFFDKTLLIGSDVPGNFLQRTGAETIKKLTGHDFIEAEFKGANKRCRMKGTFNVVVTSNNSLRVRLDGDEEAWRRRLILLRFVNPPTENRIANFGQKLIESEGAGILNWMIEGAIKALQDFKEHGRIMLPQAVQRDADELLYDSNTLNNFLDDRVVISNGSSVTTSELQNAYIHYCNSNNLLAMSSRTVAMRLVSLIKDKFNIRASNSIMRGGHKARGYKNLSLTQ